MNLSTLYEQKKCVLSFEVFPPKKTDDVRGLYRTLEGLHDLAPDYISVTYGAGGSGEQRQQTVHLADTIKREYGIEPLPHLTCINSTRETVLALLDELAALGIDNVLALRGDRVEGALPGAIEPLPHLTCINSTRETVLALLDELAALGIDNVLALRGDRVEGALPGAFHYASELVELIKSRGGFSVAGACYPEGHTEAPSLEEDIVHLRRKVDAGVSHLASQLFFDNAAFYSFEKKARAMGITVAPSLEEDIVHLRRKVDAGVSHLASQLFFDNAAFYSFEKKARAMGITVPIAAGIMPVTNKSQIERMVSLCGASLPDKLAGIIDKWGHNKAALRDAGIAYAVDQIVDLMASGVQGIHLYTMNSPYVAKKVVGSVQKLLCDLNCTEA